MSLLEKVLLCEITKICHHKPEHSLRLVVYIRGNLKMKDDKSFIKTYKWIMCGVILLAILGFVIIYLIFRNKGIIPAGINLQRSDWLSFVGGYLSFTGTLCISVITVLQTDYYNRIKSTQANKEREKAISPVFSLSANGVSADKNSFSIALQNLGKYPITSIIVNSTLLADSLKENEIKIINFSYSGVENSIKLLESDFEKDESGYSKDIIINYDDIDGHMWYQVFKFKEFEGVLYYSFEHKEKVM